MIEDVLVWNGRAADPAPSKREAFVGARHAAMKAAETSGHRGRGRTPPVDPRWWFRGMRSEYDSASQTASAAEVVVVASHPERIA